MALRLALSLLSLAAIALACECDPGTICDRIDRYPVIFLGEVVEGGLKPGEDSYGGVVGAVRLRVRELYKGLPADTKEVSIQVLFSRGMCSPSPYFNGEQILVFTGRSANGELTDGMCTASAPVKAYPEELSYTRRYFAGQTTTSIRGRVVSYRARGTLIPNARIVAHGQGREFTATTNNDGHFEIPNLPEGSYTVTAHANGYSLAEPPRPFRLAARSCQELNLNLDPTNSVEGTLSDTAHSPVPNFEVLLRNPKGKNEYGAEVRTDSLGRFRFPHVEPGTYELYVSPHGREPRSPVAKTVHPRPITVTPASKITNIAFTIPKPAPTRNIRVHLTWPDGSPVRSVSVRCPLTEPNKIPEWAQPSGTTNDAGIATCTTLTDRSYTVTFTEAGFRPRVTLTHPLRTPVPPGVNDTDVHHRLSPADRAAIKD
jgi:hypothetical protein